MTSLISIAHVVISLEPGGLENGIVNVANRLDPARFRLGVFCLVREGAFRGRLPPRVEVVCLDKPPGLSPTTVVRLARRLRLWKPDIVHTHNLGPLLYGALAAAALPRTSLLHSEHRELMPDERTRPKLFLRRRLYRRCRRIHTVADSLRDRLIDLGFPSSRLVAIPNGVDTDRFVPGETAPARRRLGLPESGLVIGIAGALRPEKGHPLLLEAFTRLAPEFPDARLLIVGGGPEEDRLRARIADSPEKERIRLTGHRDDMPDCYRAMNLMVLPSTAEGLSNAVLEAMACGIPVLASDVCGNGDAIEEERNGFLSRARTGDELARDLRSVLKREAAFPSLGQAARQTILARYSLNTMAEGYARLYGELIGGEGNGEAARRCAGEGQERQRL
ncbi:MAG: glycosyltransferase [Lentisphaerae bacterium]|nr:glycosyltransferase [Lentisphaerota bacterium]